MDPLPGIIVQPECDAAVVGHVEQPAAAHDLAAEGEWGAREFLLSTLGVLAGRLALTKKEADLEKDQLLAEVSVLTGVLAQQSLNLSGGISVLGFGGSGGKSKSTTVHRGEVSLAALQQYLQKLIRCIRRLKYSGAVLHLNNLELLGRDDPSCLQRFFDEVRDYLQTPHLYFVFVGYTGMYQEVIVPVERVRSVFFGHPVHLPPLSREDVHSAIEVRYGLLAVRPKQWIRPVDAGLIDHLYNEFSGKIRFIMDAITTLVTRLPEGATGTLTTAAAKTLLSDLTWERIRPVLTDVEQQVLITAVKQRRLTNTSLVKATGKRKQSMAKYLKRLRDLNLVHQAEQRGRSVYYEISPDVALLRPGKERR